jgi:transposase
MAGYVEGVDRTQVTLFPDRLEDYVGEDNPVRVVDAFVEALDLRELGFTRSVPTTMGRPGYHPAVLLKLYVYGYLNRIASSRRLEREVARNLELMWLTGRLAPDHKTIADFRRDNGEAIRKVCGQFVLLARKLALFGDTVVAIDGSKFKAVNNRDRNFTPAKMQRRLAEIEAAIGRYLAKMDGADAAEPSGQAKLEHLQEKLAALHAYMAELKGIDEQLRAAPDGQVSLTDPDARSMNARGSGIVGYNVQAAVDAEHHLVIAHDVVMTGSDRAQLSPMATAAREAVGAERIEVVADRGYYSGREVLTCKEAGISAHVVKPITSNAVADGRFGKEDFVYEPSSDSYRCPAGEVLTHRATANEDGQAICLYWTNSCGACSLKAHCTTGNQRRVRRWEHEHVLEEMEERLARRPELMKIRRSTVEHVFGTIKGWMGATHFLTRGLANVQTETSLQVLAYNLKRVMSIVGIVPLMTAIRAG